MRNFKVKRVSDRWLIFVLLVLIASLALILWGYGDRINDLRDHQNSLAKSNSATVTSDESIDIGAALKFAYSDQVVTDPINMRIYVPEARIYMPMNDLSRSLYYNNQAAAGGQAQVVSFNSLNNINAPIGTFNQVPCAQRLAGFTVDSRDDKAIAGTKYDSSYQLSDGRTLYFYTNSANGCKNRWSPQTPAELVNLFKQAQSY